MLVAMVLGSAIAAEAEDPSAAKPAAPPSRKPRVLVTISKETTYVTGPLRKDGYVDYIAALNQRHAQGVTPENNAAILFWKAMGPGEIDTRTREPFFKMLGIPPLPEQGDYLVTFHDYVKGRHAAKAANADKTPEELAKQFEEAGKRSWSKKELPLVADWLAANERPLALLTDACKRPRRYDPVIGGEMVSMIAVMLPAVQSYREAARMLLARAMLRVGEGKVEAAWEDLLSCHRLARLIGQGPTLVESLVAIAIDGMAGAGDQALLRSVRLTSAQAAKIRDDLGKLPAISKMAEVIDVGERFFYLDFISMAAREGPMSLGGLLLDGGDPPETIKSLINLATGAVLDWNEILHLGNSWYDRMADALRKPIRAKRKTAMGKIDEDVRKLAQKTKDIKSLALSMLGSPRQALSRRFGETLVALVLPAVSAAVDAEDRGAMQFELTRIAFALAEYRADHGSYPAKLADLVPKYVAETPKDLFVAADLHYRQEGKGGYVLYSVGVNGKDDGAKSNEDRGDSGKDWDDLVVRVPAAVEQKSN
jgi:hypothetical protein